MKLLIETCLKSYLIALIKNEKTIDYIYIDELKHKSDALAHDVKKLFKDMNLSPKELSSIYVTKGPGSFMGVRAGLIYANTLAKTLGISLYTCSSLDFLSGSVPGEYFIDAKSEQSYYKQFPSGTEKLVKTQKESTFNIKHFIQKPGDYLTLFKVDNNPKPNYLKDPKVN